MKIDSPVRAYLRQLLLLSPAARDEALAQLAPALHRIAAVRAARRAIVKRLAREAGEEACEVLDDADQEDTDFEEEEVEDAEDAGEGGAPMEEQAPLAAASGGGGGGGGSVGSGEEDESEEEEEEEGDEVFEVPPILPGAPPLRLPLSWIPLAEGTALFSVICLMNHSCTPNVQVAYMRGDHAGALLALRDLAPGEELCINYVDVRNPEPLRRVDLEHYGFRCRCARCVEERGGEGGGGGGME